MKRVLELAAEVRERHPADRFFANFRESCKANPFKRSQYKTYNRALMTLDKGSWEILKHKALTHYLDHRKGQLKQGFFNQLNEAFAYQFLKSRGFTKIQFLPEKKRKTPDIRFLDKQRQRYCEVKTLSISDDQITRRTEMNVFDGAIYHHLDERFFNKLNSSINEAVTQLASHGHDGLVFLVCTFDDISFDYYKTYRRQLMAFLRNHGAKEVYVKVGIQERRSLFKRANAHSGRRA